MGTCSAAQTPAKGWDEQRWVRLCLFMKMINERAPGVRLSLSSGLGYATHYDDLIERAGREIPPGYGRSLTADEQAAMRAALVALDAIARPETVPFAFQAVPKPELRVRPPL